MIRITSSYLQKPAFFVILAAFLLITGTALADIDIELQDWIDEIDPNAPPPGTSGGPGEPSGPPYPIGGPGAPVRLIRVAPSAYWDGIDALAGQDRPGPREISNYVLAQSGPIFSDKFASDMVWQWGQFIDHDIDLTDPAEPAEPANIRVPLCDAFFDPNCVCEGDPLPGSCFIPLNRSVFDPTTGLSLGNPRQQLNVITAILDASNIYGSDPERTLGLRTLDGSGRLKTSAGDFLPYNYDRCLVEVPQPECCLQGPCFFSNAQLPTQDPADLFLSGDVRTNETVPLTSMHTLWMREHNTIADAIRASYPQLSGDLIFYHARRILITEMQIVTFNEFLPVILGSRAIPRYSGYHSNVNPGINNEFSTAMYRLGHTMLSSVIRRLDANGNTIFEGDLPLMHAFFTPDTLVDEGGLEPLMKGLSSQVMQRIDSKIVDDVRNFLFGPPGSGGLDLASLNIQRGRDHGLPDYNTLRLYYGLTPVSSFAEITSDTDVQNKLATIYGSVDKIDPWVGALAEDPYDRDVLVGELLYTALSDQFTRMRDGDPDWYQNILPINQQRAAEKMTLAKIIARNTTLDRRDLNANVFIVK